jgi:hypothetical protein
VFRKLFKRPANLDYPVFSVFLHLQPPFGLFLAKKFGKSPAIKGEAAKKPSKMKRYKKLCPGILTS